MSTSSLPALGSGWGSVLAGEFDSGGQVGGNGQHRTNVCFEQAWGGLGGATDSAAIRSSDPAVTPWSAWG